MEASKKGAAMPTSRMMLLKGYAQQHFADTNLLELSSITVKTKISLLLQNCIGKQSCSVAVAPEVFGGDPCPGSTKKLSVEAVCS